MRRYAPNSPQSAARLLALALLADGGIDASELRSLEHHRVFQRLGLTVDQFDATTREFCEDLLSASRHSLSGQLDLDPELIDALLAEVSDPTLRKKLLRAMLDIVHADGHLAGGEAVLMSRALHKWDLDLFEVADTSLPRRRKAVAQGSGLGL